MTTRNADVNLTIRAKTDGERNVAELASIIDRLIGGASAGADDIAELGRAIGALDKSAAALAAAQEKVSGSASKQASAIHAATASIAEQQERVDTLQRGLSLLQAEADKAFVGPRREGLVDTIRSTKAELADAEKQVARFGRSLDTNLAGLRSSRSNLLDLGRATTAVAEQQGRAAEAVEQTTAALDRQAAASKRAAQENRQAAAPLAAIQRSQYQDSGKSAELSAGVFGSAGLTATERQLNLAEQLAAKEAETTAALHRQNEERQRGATLAAIQRSQYQDSGKSAELSAGVFARGGLTDFEKKIEAAEQKATALATAAEVQPKLALFGLKPYELQNLSYQINDVATQLASGTSLARTLGQQGGQIVQIFPRITSAIIAAFTNPAFLGAAAVVGGIALALKKAADDAERLRTNTAQTTFRADGGDYDPKKLGESADALKRIGASAADATVAVKTLLDDGIAPAKLDQFARAAQNTAEVLGLKLPDAAQSLATAFTGGYDAVAALDDKFNFLTASEREHIKALFESGNAEAARTEALNAYSRQAEAAAAKQRGPWSDAALSLGKAWRSFIQYIADSTPIKAAVYVLDELAAAVKGVGDAINGSLAKSGAAADNGLAETQNKIATLKREIADYEAQIAKKSPIAGTLRRLVEDSKAQLAEAERHLAELEKKAPDTANTDPNSQQAKRRHDELERVNREDELQRLRDAGQVRILTAAEQARRAELAGLEATRGATDAVVAAAERRRAIAHETAAIEKESDARAKQAQAEREHEIKQFEGRVVGAEGGAGKNPYSSAKGFGQFTESTFLSQFGKVYPGQASSLSRDQILALRNNEQVARAIIDSYARENAKFLESFGAKVTAGNLYLAHFLGPAGAKAVLTAADNKPVDQVLARLPRAAQVLSGNQGYLRTEGGKGRYRTAGELRNFIADRVGDTGTAQTEGQAALNRLLEAAETRQNEFNLAVRHGAEDQQRATESLRAEIGLRDTALLAEQRRQAVTRAELELRQKVEDANKNLKPGETAVVVSPEQIANARELAGALFDAQHAADALTAQIAGPQRDLDADRERVDLLKQQAEFYRSIGDIKDADDTDKKVVAANAALADSIQKVIDAYQNLGPALVEAGVVTQDQLDNIIDKLKQSKVETQTWGKVAGVSAQSIAQAFGSTASSAFTNFINKVASGENVFKSLGEGIREFAANFLSSIAQMIVQLLAFAAVAQVLRLLNVPIPSGLFGVGQHHDGGIVGASAGGVRRPMAPAAFATAMRFHTGGIAGFGPDEVPAILKRNEEVLTEGDPRHRFNGGLNTAGDSGPKSVKIVNAYDPSSLMEHSLSTKEGESVMLNFVQKNSRAFKAAIG